MDELMDQRHKSMVEWIDWSMDESVDRWLYKSTD